MSIRPGRVTDTLMRTTGPGSSARGTPFVTRSFEFSEVPQRQFEFINETEAQSTADMIDVVPEPQREIDTCRLINDSVAVAGRNRHGVTSSRVHGRRALQDRRG